MKRRSFKMPKAKCVKRLVPKTRRGTIVGMVKRSGAIFLIACPPGHMARTGKCKSGTKAVEVIKAARGGKCPAGYKRA